MVVDIKQRLLTMLDGAFLTDVLFIVQGEEMKCHKLILSSCESRLKELVANNPEKIDIDDVSPHTFREILKYLYADDCVVTDSNVFELMHASQKFALADLEHSCSEFIKNKLTESNVSFFTGQALQFDAKGSLEVCLDYFKKNTLNVLSTKQFLEIPKKALLILSGNKNAECSESRFFTACFDWAKEECKRQNLEQVHKNLRNVLGEDVLSQIKFQKMSLKEFLNIVVPAKILTHEEIGRHIEEFQGRPIKVTITDFSGKTTNIYRPMTFSIQWLKKEKIWNEGQEHYSADKFTLSHKGKTLHDDMTLADLITPGEELSLLVNSVDITLQNIHNSAHKYSFTLTSDKLSDATNVIGSFIYRMERAIGRIHYRLHGTNQQWSNTFSNNLQMLLPGSIISYEYY